VQQSVAKRKHLTSRIELRAVTTAMLVVVAAACVPAPEPRSVFYFMDDAIAREGVLTRCNRDRDATLKDVECANARRAAATIALEAERARATELERESERKLLAVRDRQAREAAAAEQAAAAARAAAEAAYEAQWPNSRGPRGDSAGAGQAVPTFGVPPGSVMPSMTDSTVLEVYAVGPTSPQRHTFEIAAAEPPANDIEIPKPELELAELAVIPRPFRADDSAPR
jgi:hypothetical protein